VSSPAHRTADYRRRRAALAAALAAAGVIPCGICGKPVTARDRWDANHANPVAHGGADGPLEVTHARCNRKAGGGIRTRHRAAPSRDW
jgi:hypothetical protein